jgi:hypothetical protein
VQDPAEFDIMVVAAHDPIPHAREAQLVQSTLNNGVPVLYLQLTSQEIKDSIGNRTGLVVTKDHPALLVLHRRGDASNPSHTEFTELHETLENIITAESDGTTTERTPSDTEAAQLRSARADSNVEEVIKFIEESKDARQKTVTEKDAFTRDNQPQFQVDTPPDYAVYRRQTMNVRQDTHLNTTGQLREPVLTRTHQLGITLDVYAFYDTVSDQYQVFLVQRGTAYIDTRDNNHFMGRYFVTGVLTVEDLYLVQRGLSTSVTCSDPNAFVVDSSPKNINDSTTYTDDTSATVSGGISKDGIAVGASYTVTHSEQHTIYQWSISNTSSAVDQVSWRYFRTNQGNSRYGDYPALSTNNFAYSNSSLWTFPGSTQQVTFTIRPTRSFYYAPTSFIPLDQYKMDVAGTPINLTVALPKIQK